MKTIKLIGKNIGVIVLSILVLIIGAIAESLVQEYFSGQLFTPCHTGFCKDCSYDCFCVFCIIKTAKNERRGTGTKTKKAGY